MIRGSSKILLSAGRFPTVSLAEGGGDEPLRQRCRSRVRKFRGPRRRPGRLLRGRSSPLEGGFPGTFFSHPPQRIAIFPLANAKKEKKPPRGAGSRLRGPRRPAAAGPGPAGPGLISPQPPPGTRERRPRQVGVGTRADFCFRSAPAFFYYCVSALITFRKFAPEKKLSGGRAKKSKHR